MAWSPEGEQTKDKGEGSDRACLQRGHIIERPGRTVTLKLGGSHEAKVDLGDGQESIVKFSLIKAYPDAKHNVDQSVDVQVVFNGRPLQVLKIPPMSVSASREIIAFINTSPENAHYDSSVALEFGKVTDIGINSCTLRVHERPEIINYQNLERLAVPQPPEELLYYVEP